MKYSALSFVMAGVLAISTSQNLSAQVSSSDQKIADIQAAINSLQSELESLRAEQNSRTATLPELNAPTSVLQTAEPTPASNGTPTLPTTTNYPPAYNSAPVNSAPIDGYYPPAYSQYSAPMEPVYVPQPPVVIVEQPYWSNGYGGVYGGGYGRGYGGGYGGSGLYIGNNGWGLGIGGVQLDFHGHGGHGGGGHGRGGNGGGNKGNKGNKGHKH